MNPAKGSSREEWEALTDSDDSEEDDLVRGPTTNAKTPGSHTNRGTVLLLQPAGRRISAHDDDTDTRFHDLLSKKLQHCSNHIGVEAVSDNRAAKNPRSYVHAVDDLDLPTPLAITAGADGNGSKYDHPTSDSKSDQLDLIDLLGGKLSTAATGANPNRRIFLETLKEDKTEDDCSSNQPGLLPDHGGVGNESEHGVFSWFRWGFGCGGNRGGFCSNDAEKQRRRWFFGGLLLLLALLAAVVAVVVTASPRVILDGVVVPVFCLACGWYALNAICLEKWLPSSSSSSPLSSSFPSFTLARVCGYGVLGELCAVILMAPSSRTHPFRWLIVVLADGVLLFYRWEFFFIFLVFHWEVCRRFDSVDLDTLKNSVQILGIPETVIESFLRKLAVWNSLHPLIVWLGNSALYRP